MEFVPSFGKIGEFQEKFLKKGFLDRGSLGISLYIPSNYLFKSKISFKIQDNLQAFGSQKLIFYSTQFNLLLDMKTNHSYAANFNIRIEK